MFGNSVTRPSATFRWSASVEMSFWKVSPPHHHHRVNNCKAKCEKHNETESVAFPPTRADELFIDNKGHVSIRVC